jgi:CubicO group peptidase (beta-lactamase class C family)
MKHSIPSCVLAVVLIAACAAVRPLPSTATAAVPSQDSEGEVAARLDAYMVGQVTNLSFTGSVLVARQGRVLLLGGFGAADRAGGLSNTAQTKFRVASITKQFTALAILILQARGELNVQDRACAYLPDCPPAWKAITIHQLLTHTSGIASYKDFPDYPAFRATPAAPAELTAHFRDLPLAFEPGGHHSYSNSGYVLLGNIIERQSGITYAEFVKQNILDPLGMSATGFLNGPQGLAVGYENSYDLTPASPGRRVG